MTPAEARPTTILVVEDDPWIRSLLTDLLPTEGYDVEEASNATGALRAAREHHPDVVLLDLALPEMSGLDVLRELRGDRATAGLPVIVASAYTDQLEATDAPRADVVVQKPFDLTDLLDQIERLT